MPATSQKQARFARMCEHADHPPEKCPAKGTLTHFEHVGKTHLTGRKRGKGNR